MSVDVRGNGAIAWRLVTGSAVTETVGAERRVYPFHESLLYYVKATWGNNAFNVTFKENGFNGNTIFDFGKPYPFTYKPSPHNAYAGRPFVQGSRDTPSSFDGAVIRQVWISARPRPASANK